MFVAEKNGRIIAPSGKTVHKKSYVLYNSSKKFC